MKNHIKMPEKISFILPNTQSLELAKKIKKLSPFIHISLYVLKQNKDFAFADYAGNNVLESFSESDLTFLNSNGHTMLEFTKKFKTILKKGSIVSSLSPYLSFFVDKLRPIFLENAIHFIPCHFIDDTAFIATVVRDDPAAANIIREFWRDAEICPLEIEACFHDRALLMTQFFKDKYDFWKMFNKSFAESATFLTMLKSIHLEISSKDFANYFVFESCSKKEIYSFFQKNLNNQNFNELDNYLKHGKILPTNIQSEME